MAIPIVMLYVFIRKKKKFPFRHIWLLYVVFILSCGFTHLIEAITSYHPIERFSGLVKLITAIASWLTVFSLVKVIPAVIAMNTPEELEQIVAQRTKDLEAALKKEEALTALLRQREEQLLENDRQRTNFLAMLAHELRNPLAPVRTNVYLIKEKYAHCLDGKFLEMDEMINRQLNHLSRMIDDLLDVARIKSGKIKLSMMPVNVAKSIDGVMSVLSSHNLIGKRRINVTCPQDVYVMADGTRLEQIITNLMTNSLKYTKDDGEIYVSVDLKGDDVHIIVRDNGKGIHPNAMPNIFDLFYQSEQSIDRASGGLGIGLTIVKKLMDLHGGTVTVHSEVGVGTTVDLKFATVSPEHVKPYKREGKRILIVEDNVDAARSLSMLFDQHEVRICHDGNSAVVIANLFDPDVVVLDIGLPGLSGFEVARALRSSTVTENVKIVAVSGYSRNEDIMEAKTAGVNEYVVKPAEIRKLLEVVLNKA